jgi:hypothetical protein
MKYFLRWTTAQLMCLGGTVEHTYKEGVYNAKIIERLLTGKEQ